MAVNIYNSLSKKVEEFIPLNDDLVTMYTCGPTVYDYVHIGNYRTYSLADFIYRVFEFNDYKVKYIMNITDVGHLTGDNLGDADTGEDRLEVTAEREGKSAREIANFYTKDFLDSYGKLNMTKPDKFPKATEYIEEQIEMVKKLEERGCTYEISDGVYFDTSKFKDYGKLSGLHVDTIREGARVEPNPEKRNPNDFALWKFSPPDQMRWQEWNSPWGRGFPGWHIECSSMAMEELGETIDIHLGGEDLRMIHHQNEIAQSESVTGKQFVRYWVHGAFLQVNERRMSKSEGTLYTLADVENKSFDPLALRYFYMTAHYRSRLNFTWDSLQAAANALRKLYELVEGYQEDKNAPIALEFLGGFERAINNDINMPEALAVVWDMMKGDLSEGSKINTLLKFDEVLALNIEDHVGFEIPQEVVDLAKVRFEYRKRGIYDKADMIRREIEQKGFVVDDTAVNYKLRRKM